jgi:hypothetical protein
LSAPKARRANPTLRWLSVLLRGIHLATVIGLGAALLGAPLAVTSQAHGVLASGLAMLILDLAGKPRMLLEWSGTSLLLKLAVVAWMAFDIRYRLPLFWAIVIWSAIFAHAPASFRHRRWWGPI